MPKTRSTAKEWEGAQVALQESYQQILKNPQPMLLFVGVYTALTIISLIIQGYSTVNEKGYQSYADLAILYFMVPLLTYSLALADKKMLELQDFLQFTVKQFLFVLGASILAGLAVAGSAILLLVPIIWTIAWFAASSYVALDRGLKPIAALKESKRISQAHKGKVWGVIGLSILLSFVAAFFSLIPYIGVAATAFTSVLTSALLARLYRWLQAAAK